jgi:UDP-glucose 4-epimerase
MIKKSALITGGSGFIGMHLISKLQENGYIVDIFDRKNGQDIKNINDLKKVVQNNYDVIYHLAGLSGSKESNEKKISYFQINTLATINLMELIVNYAPNSKLILSSSRLEYGKPQYNPVDENHKTEPTSAYGLSKLIATQMAQVFGSAKNLNYIAFRTSNVYGPHKEEKFFGYNLINYYIDQAKKGKTLLIFGNGNQLRDYIYIDDLVQAFLMAAESKMKQKIYNLGFGEGTTLKNMTKLIIKTVNKGNIKFVTWPIDYHKIETGSYVSNISKIKKELGFKPKISFKEGIQKTLDFEI